MAFVAWQTTVVDGSGNIVPSAEIEVRKGGSLATIYSDDSGTALTNPFNANASTGFAQFFADFGVYDVMADIGSGSLTWQVTIGPDWSQDVELQGSASFQDGGILFDFSGGGSRVRTRSENGSAQSSLLCGNSGNVLIGSSVEGFETRYNGVYATTASSASTFMNRAMSDDRYLLADGETRDIETSGKIILDSNGTATNPSFLFSGSQSIGNVGFWMSSGHNVNLSYDGTSQFTFQNGGNLYEDISVVTRGAGDERYQLSSSDALLKSSIEAMPDVGAIVDAVQPRNFEWIEDADDPKPVGEQFGFIAQEVGEAFPPGMKDGTLKGVDALSMISVLWREVQSLRARMAELETTE